MIVRILNKHFTLSERGQGLNNNDVIAQSYLAPPPSYTLVIAHICHQRAPVSHSRWTSLGFTPTACPIRAAVTAVEIASVSVPACQHMPTSAASRESAWTGDHRGCAVSMLCAVCL